MNTLTPANKSLETNGLLLDLENAKYLFNVLKANVIRSRTTITAIFLAIHDYEDFYDEEADQIQIEVTKFLQSTIRQTDMLFPLESPGLAWGVILSQSGEREAKAFFQRLHSEVENKSTFLFQSFDLSFSASIAEIGTSDATFESLLESGCNELSHSLRKGVWQIEYVPLFKERKIETIKVSILEENDIFRHVLQTSVEGLPTEGFQLELKTFQDGYEFMESNWYLSSHTHIVIMNDTLPRKNGLEVLHTLRQLPNNRRFTIFMMTKMNSEETMIYAYEKGVDDYLNKPFNIRLFEAKMKRIFKRFWS